MSKSSKTTLFVAQAGIIAAAYVALTWLSSLVGLSSGVIQVRISEALCVLPMFTSAAIPGLTIGCVLSNLLTGALPLDVLFGSLATLIGAVIAYFVGKAAVKKDSLFLKILVPFPNVITNTLIVPWVLKLVYGFDGTVAYFMLTVGAGELIAGVAIGLVVLFALQKNSSKIFR